MLFFIFITELNTISFDNIPPFKYTYQTHQKQKMQIENNKQEQ